MKAMNFFRAGASASTIALLCLNCACERDPISGRHDEIECVNIIEIGAHVLQEGDRASSSKGQSKSRIAVNQFVEDEKLTEGLRQLLAELEGSWESMPGKPALIPDFYFSLVMADGDDEFFSCDNTTLFSSSSMAKISARQYEVIADACLSAYKPERPQAP